MSTANANLDLSSVDNDDYDKLSEEIETFYNSDSASKSQMAYSWERNHMMLDGKQWLQYEGNQATGGMWKPLKVSRQNEYIPRPVTNYLFDIYQTLKSYLIKNKPRSQVFPNTETYQDKVASKLATMCLEVNWQRLREQQNYENAAAVLITYGTVFKKAYWDTTTVSMVKVPKMEQRPTLDPNTGIANGGMEEVPVLSPDGDPMYDELPLGDVATDIVEPYRLAIDPLAMDLHRARWVMEYAIQPLNWIIETYGKDPSMQPGFTGLAETVKEEPQLSGSMKRFYNLRQSSGTRNNGLESGTATDQMIKNAAVVKEYYERPSQQFPKGRLVVVANHVVLFAGDSPYSGNDMGDWHPYSECRWELVPGRFWGHGPLDDAVEIQKRINSIDSLSVLVRKTMAIPQKLIPLGQGLTPGMWTGRPAQEVFYKDSGTGAKPETIPGEGLDPSVAAERAQCVADLKEITGAIDILKGDRPPGVNAASALSLLYEVGTGKLFPVLDRWKAFVECDQKKQLQLIQKFYKEPRPEFVKSLRAKNTELSDQEINKFLGTDLFDHCNVTVEAGSNVPKLQAAQQSRLMELAQVGVLNLNMPANRMQFLQDMGVTGYDNDIGPDTKRAEWENAILDNIANTPDNKPVVLDCDAHDVHIAEHEKRQKEPAFMALPSEVQKAYAMHIQEHQQFQQQQMQAQILQQQATGAPIQPPQSATAPQPLHSAGKGAAPSAKAAVMGGSDLQNPGAPPK